MFLFLFYFFVVRSPDVYNSFVLVLRVQKVVLLFYDFSAKNVIAYDYAIIVFKNSLTIELIQEDKPR